MEPAFKELHWRRDIPVKEYLLPGSLPEALDMLERFKGKARVIAGGTDVIPELRRRDLQVKALVDISRIPGMNAIEKNGRHIILGGLVTHGQVAASSLIREKAGLLADGAAAVGSPQIRNIATVAGNLVSGRPAADTSIPLLALEASVTIASKKGERVVPLTEFFVSVGETVLDSSREVLTRIRFQGLRPDQGGCYLRLSKRRALSLPVLVAAAVVTVDSNARVFKKAAIALGPVAPTPFRARASEAGLKGAPLSREAIQKAAGLAVQECFPRDSLLRGSCNYRQEMIVVFIRRSVQQALEQAGFSVD
jgi:carbon-monoxide dehydrogenase medium subunit